MNGRKTSLQLLPLLHTWNFRQRVTDVSHHRHLFTKNGVVCQAVGLERAAMLPGMHRFAVIMVGHRKERNREEET